MSTQYFGQINKFRSMTNAVTFSESKLCKKPVVMLPAETLERVLAGKDYSARLNPADTFVLSGDDGKIIEKAIATSKGAHASDDQQAAKQASLLVKLQETPYHRKSVTGPR